MKDLIDFNQITEQPSGVKKEIEYVGELMSYKQIDWTNESEIINWLHAQFATGKKKQIFKKTSCVLSKLNIISRFNQGVAKVCDLLISNHKCLIQFDVWFNWISIRRFRRAKNSALNSLEHQSLIESVRTKIDYQSNCPMTSKSIAADVQSVMINDC